MAVADKELVMTGGGGFTVSVSVAVPVPPGLLALSITENVPAADGVPLINPVETLTVIPAGRPVALKLVGEFVAVI